MAIRLACFVLVLVFAATSVSSQPLPQPAPAVGQVDLEIVQPHVLLAPGGTNVTVRVLGSIQCDDGAAPPPPIAVLTGVSTRAGEFVRVDASEQTVPWVLVAGSSGFWSADSELLFRFEPTQPQDDRSHETTRLFLTRSIPGDDACTTRGYEIHGDQDYYRITYPPRGGLAPQEDAPKQLTGQSAAVNVAWFLGGLLVGIAVTIVAVARIRRPPR